MKNNIKKSSPIDKTWNQINTTCHNQISELLFDKLWKNIWDVSNNHIYNLVKGNVRNNLEK